MCTCAAPCDDRECVVTRPYCRDMDDPTVGVLPMLMALNHSSVAAAAADWWAGVAEEDALRSLPLDGEGGLWASSFVPPPPRPAYLVEENVSSDGLTTCDLCTWAWRDDALTFVIDAAQDTEELGWVFTLAVVSVLSAVIGAVIMITLLQCRNRIKSIGSTCSLCVARPPHRRADSPGQQGQGHKEVALALGGPPPGGGARRWFSGGRRPRAQLCAAPTTPAENHYTLDGEALYAELDKEASPAYQNTAYTAEEDRTYEAVGEGPPRTTVPSDYV